MTTFDVGNETDLNNTIHFIETSGFPNNYVIDITGTITLSSQLLAINLQSGSTLTIQGTNGSGGAQVQAIDGANTYNGFFVYSGDVTIEDLTLENMKAQRRSRRRARRRRCRLGRRTVRGGHRRQRRQ